MSAELAAGTSVESAPRFVAYSPDFRSAATARSLQQAFRAHLGTTPIAYLRDRRLELARQKLLDHVDQPITDVALACGFTHLSRFARYYRERFGETPHATRRH